MRKTLFIVLSVILLQQSTFASQASGEITLEDCRKFGNNSNGATTRFEDGGHIQNWSNFLKPQGRIKTLIIPIDFPDAPHLTSLNEINTFGSKVSKEFSRLSNSKVNLEISTTGDWIRMPLEGKYYVTANWTQKINDALDFADPVIDFSNYDLVLIKVDERNSPIDSAGALPMWGEHLGDGIKFLRGVFLGNDYWTKNGQGTQVAVHEIGHVFGLADLYQQNYDGQFPVGIYDLMSTFRTPYELNLLGWNKWKLGWLDESNLKCISISSPKLLSFSVDKTKWNPIFIPYQDKVIGIELWSNPYASETVFALIYEVSPKTYVWRSNGESGKVSPIQLFKPYGTTRTSSNDPQLNLGAKFSYGDFIEIYGQKFQFLGKGKNNFYVSVTPIGQSVLDIPLEDQQIKTISKVQISCIKGKSIKKVTALKPVCPSGYKKII